MYVEEARPLAMLTSYLEAIEINAFDEVYSQHPQPPLNVADDSQVYS